MPLSPAPTENGVTQQPYRLQGTVSDEHLASFTLNGTPVALTPGSLPGDYRFDLALQLTTGTPLTLDLSARDQAGNRTLQSYLLRLDASVDLKLLLPAAATELVHSGAPIPLQVAVEITGCRAPRFYRTMNQIIHHTILPLFSKFPALPS